MMKRILNNCDKLQYFFIENGTIYLPIRIVSLKTTTGFTNLKAFIDKENCFSVDDSSRCYEYDVEFLVCNNAYCISTKEEKFRSISKKEMELQNKNYLKIKPFVLLCDETAISFLMSLKHLNGSLPKIPKCVLKHIFCEFVFPSLYEFAENKKQNN